MARAHRLCNHPFGLFALAEMGLVALLAIGLLAGVIIRAIVAWSAEERSAAG